MFNEISREELEKKTGLVHTEEFNKFLINYDTEENFCVLMVSCLYKGVIKNYKVEVFGDQPEGHYSEDILEGLHWVSQGAKDYVRPLAFESNPNAGGDLPSSATQDSLYSPAEEDLMAHSSMNIVKEKNYKLQRVLSQVILLIVVLLAMALFWKLYTMQVV